MVAGATVPGAGRALKQRRSADGHAPFIAADARSWGVAQTETLREFHGGAFQL